MRRTTWRDGGRAWTVVFLAAMTAAAGQAPHAWGQTPLSLTTRLYSQDFNSIVTSSAATLPGGWAFASGTAPTWSGTSNTTVTTKGAGLVGTGSMTSNASGGAFLFVDGSLASGTDKAIGFLTSNSYSSPRSILFGFTNSTGSDVSSLTVGWDYEKYRNGSRAFDWKFYGSSDGTAWTPFSAGDKAYAADAAIATIGAVVPSAVSPLSINSTITSGGSYYLRWDYVGSGGSTNAQALGIDNFTLSLSGGVAPPPTTTGLYWDANGSAAGVGGSGTWATGGTTFATTVEGTAVGSLAATGTVAFAGTAGTVTVAGAVAPPGGLQFSTTGYTLAGGTITFGGSGTTTITADAGVSAVVNSVLTQATGSAAIVKAGAGSLTLGGDNRFAGGLTVASGTLAAATSTALGSGPVTVGSGGLVAGSGATLANAITVAASGTATGAASLVAGWDFQTSTTGGTVVAAAPATQTSFKANFGSGTLSLDGSNGSSVWASGAANTELNTFSGTPLNAAPGFSVTTGSGALALVAGSATAGSFSANGKSAVFTLDMTGRQNLVVSLAEQRTATGFTSEAWSYSTDGATWTTFQTLGAAEIPQSFGIVTLNAISGLDNVSTAYVRMTVDGATSAAGNLRLDNIQFNATSLGAQVVAAATLGTDVAGGQVEFAGPVTLGGSVNLLAADTAAVLFSGTISGAGGVRKVGEGTVTIAADATYSGGTTIEAGQMRLGAGGGTGSVVGSVQLLGPASSLAIDRSDDLSLATAISGSGGVFKEGGNTVRLTGSSSYTGGTTLFAGTLVVGDGGTQGSLATDGPVDLSVGTTLAFDRVDDIAFSGAVTGAGRVVQTGLGTLTLSQAGRLGDATLRVESGVVNLARAGASLEGVLGAGNAVELAGGTLQLSSDAGEETKFTGAAVRVEADSTLAINRTGAAGDHTTTGFAAPMNLANGATLSFDYRGGFSSNTQPVVRYKGTTTFTGTVTLESSAGVSVTNSGGGLAEVVFAGPVVDGSDGFDLVKTGDQRLTLAAANSFGGSTLVREGTLALAAAGSIADSPVVAVSAGATFDVTAKTGGYVLPATQSITGAGAVDGAVTVGGGGTLEPGAGLGLLTVTRGLTWAGGGDYNWQIGDAAGVAGTGWDLVAVGGALDITATRASPFQINLGTLSGGAAGQAANFDPTTNFTWKIAEAGGGITGFAADKFQVNVSAFNGAAGFSNALGGGSFSVAQSGNAINVVFTKAGGPPPPPPAVVTIAVAAGSTTQGQAGFAVLSGTTPVEKTGGGTLVLDQANPLVGPVTVAQGGVRLDVGGALTSSTVTVAANAVLTMGPRVEATVAGLAVAGLVDVGNGRLTVTAGLLPGDLAASIAGGYGDGTWNGTSGIVSSAAAGESFRGVGWRDNGDGSLTFGFAAQGDTNLDGFVDLDDLQSILAAGKYGTGVAAGWSEGDFNYDGIVDLADIQDVLAGGLYGQADSYLTRSMRTSRLAAGRFDPLPFAGLALPESGLGGVVAVPEPSTWGMATAAVLLLALRFRGRRRTPLSLGRVWLPDMEGGRHEEV